MTRIELKGLKQTFLLHLVIKKDNANKARMLLDENKFKYTTSEVAFNGMIKFAIKAKSITSLYLLNQLLKTDKTLLLK